MSKSYTLYWLDGTKSKVQGNSIAGAFSTQYSGGALPVLDVYEEGDEESYIWVDGRWVNKQMHEHG